MAKQTVLTGEGLEKLKAELTQLTTVTRKEVAEQLKTARGYGDLSENSEYDEAKNRQAQVEARIMELEATLANVKVVDRSELSTGTVNIGSHLRMLDVEFNEEMEVWIVGASEAEPETNRLSDESPIGRALMGRKKGDVVVAEAPSGDLKFEILEVFDK